MIKNKKTFKVPTNILLFIGFIILTIGVIRIGNVTFMSIDMIDIEEEWILAVDEGTRGYYCSYDYNDTVYVISQISYVNTIEDVLTEPALISEKHMISVFEDLQKIGYTYLYQLDDTDTILVSTDYYRYDGEAISLKLKLHDLFLGETGYWIWSIELKGDPPSKTIAQNIPLVVVGFLIMGIGGLYKSKSKNTEKIPSRTYINIYNDPNEKPQEFTIDIDEKREWGKICRKCGLILNRPVIFCPKCGQKRDEYPYNNNFYENRGFGEINE